MNDDGYDLHFYWNSWTLMRDTIVAISNLPEPERSEISAVAAREVDALTRRLNSCIGDAERLGDAPGPGDLLVGRLLAGAAGAYAALLFPPSSQHLRLGSRSDRGTDHYGIHKLVEQIKKVARGEDPAL